MKLRRRRYRQPSAWWLTLGGLCCALALAAAIASVVVQRAASTPIGEGEVFVADTEHAREFLAESDDADNAVRRLRNDLEIEAVSLIDGTGMVVASTTASMDDQPLTSPFLQFAASEERFAAIAATVGMPISIDGVVEWDAGSVLYQVVSPVDDGHSVVMHYDISALLARRVRPGGIRSATLQLAGLAGLFAILGLAVIVGHRRAQQRQRAAERESEILRRSRDKLRDTNIELARAQREAERALALAEEKIRIRSEFVLMINHELRTPLTTVVTGARMIKEEDLGDHEFDELLEAMIRDGTRLEEIIDQILAVARIENRGLSYTLSDTPLDEVAASVERSGVDSTVASDSELSAQTDAKALALIVTSLADNASTHGAENVKFAYASEPAIHPMVEVGRRPAEAVFLTVTDDGPGIPEDFLPRIFEKFEKSSFSSGTGLGLYMARLMVEALDGSLAVHTTPKGTTFQIAVPATPAIELAEAV